MKRLFRFRKLATALASTGTVLALVGGTALAWGSASVSVTPCDPSASTCVDVFQPVIRTFEKPTGPSFTDIANGVFHPVIRMDNVPNGFYKVEANGILDVPAVDITTAPPTPDTALGDFDWTCTLYMATADNGSGAPVDSWESEADSLTDTTFFLKAGVNLNSSSGEGSFRVDCAETAPANFLGIWSTSSLKIIAVDASDLIHQPGS
jgi:hypothetical protein